MKYADKYPDMKDIHDERDLIIKGTSDKPCFNCGTPTPYIEISFEAHMCSEECNDQKWREYEEDCAKAVSQAAANEYYGDDK